MRGAVLHKLGLNCVKERIMRRHYGVVYNKPFDSSKDPVERKGYNLRGEAVCKDSMRWYAKKVSSQKSSS